MKYQTEYVKCDYRELERTGGEDKEAVPWWCQRGCVRRKELSEKTVSLRKAFISIGGDG